jgi:uncharacterized protein with HEPN domain
MRLGASTISGTCSTRYSSRARTSSALDKNGFLADRRTQQAVILNIVILDEAATKLGNDYPEFVERYPDVPWKSMRGMRNRMAHGYFDVDLSIVWQTVQSSLPALAERLAEIRDEEAGRKRSAPAARVFPPYRDTESLRLDSDKLRQTESVGGEHLARV